MRSPYLLAVHAFVFNSQGKVLLLRRANTGYQDGWFSVPAGHVEGREWVKDAMERELQEEVGLKASIQAPVHVMQRLEDQERIDYFYEIRKWEGQITNCEPGKCQ